MRASVARYRFHFEDYSVEDLVQIVNIKLDLKGCALALALAPRPRPSPSPPSPPSSSTLTPTPPPTITTHLHPRLHTPRPPLTPHPSPRTPHPSPLTLTPTLILPRTPIPDPKQERTCVVLACDPAQKKLLLSLKPSLVESTLPRG